MILTKNKSQQFYKFSEVKNSKLFYLFFGPWARIHIPDPIRIQMWIR